MNHTCLLYIGKKNARNANQKSEMRTPVANDLRRGGCFSEMLKCYEVFDALPTDYDFSDKLSAHLLFSEILQFEIATLKQME